MVRSLKYLLVLVFLILTTSFFVASAVQASGISNADMPVYNVTAMTDYLKNLPPPKQRVPVAVYQIVDKTGQHLEMKDYSSMSTAVTQGATDMLIHSLIQSGQFKVADRSIFQSIMTEQDLQGKKRLAPGEEHPAINQLMGSKYIITGAVTEYGLTRTGGTKLKVDGKGASSENAVAYAAIDLRVVDSSTNEVVYSVSLRDDIKGTSLGGDVFSFFGKELLIDFETGTGWQEPINLVVRRLIDAAVYEMCVKFFAEQTGIQDALDPEAIASFNKALAQGAEVIKLDKGHSGKQAVGIFLLLLAVGLSAVN